MASIQSKKNKSGKVTHYVVLSLGGRRKWIKAGTMAEAKILKREIESLEKSKRLDKLGFSVKEKRIDDFFQEYASYIRDRSAPGTVKRYLAVINTFITFLKMFHPTLKNLSQISCDTIESYQTRRLHSIRLKIASDGVKSGNHSNKRLPLPQTVNNEVTMLAIAFNWAYKRDLISSAPTRRIKKLRPKPKKEARILTEKESNKLLKAAQKVAVHDSRLSVYIAVFKFLLNTGLRSGELCNLYWNDVDLDSGLIKIRAKDGWTPKTSERAFYLNDTSLKLLHSLFPQEGLIFKSNSGKKLAADDIRRVLIKVGKVAGLKNVTRVHDFRHTFNSHMQMQGVDAATMARILGHKDLSTTMIYTHQTVEHLKKSINKVGIG